MAAAAIISNSNKSLLQIEEALGNNNNKEERLSLLNTLLSQWCDIETAIAVSEQEEAKEKSVVATTTITTAMIFRQMIQLEERLVRQENTIEGLQETVQKQQNCIEIDLKLILNTLKGGNNIGVKTATASPSSSEVSDYDGSVNSDNTHNNEVLKEMMLHPSSLFTSVRTIDVEQTEPVNYDLQNNDNDDNIESTIRTDDAIHPHVGIVDQDLLSRVFDYIPSVHSKSSKESRTDIKINHHTGNNNNNNKNDVDQNLLSKVFNNDPKNHNVSASKNSSMISENAADLDSLKGKTMERIMKKKSIKRLSHNSSKKNKHQEIQFNASDLNEGELDVYRSVHSLAKQDSIFKGEQIDDGKASPPKPYNKQMAPSKPTRTKSVDSLYANIVIDPAKAKNNNATGLGGVGGAMIVPQYKKNSRRLKLKKPISIATMSVTGSESMFSVKENDVLNQQELDFDINQSCGSMPALSLCKTKSFKTVRSQKTIEQHIPEEGEVGEMSLFGGGETVYSQTPSVAFRHAIMEKSKIQEVSSLTLDPEIEALQYDNKTLITITSNRVQDRYGEEGTYTGTINIDERLPEGFGKMEYDNLRFYEGDWKIGRWHGFGYLVNPNGDTYEGEFVYDARHGQGVYKFKNGDIYEGAFSQDKRHGKGTFMFKNGNKYKGELVHGNFEGQGRYDFSGGFYEGEWEDGLYEGIGRLKYIDGGCYSGQFLKGVAYGNGEEIFPDGTERKGIWKSGKFVRSTDV